MVNAYNCTRNDSTGYSPFYLLYGRHPRLPIDIIFDLDRSVNNNSHTEYTQKWKAAMQEAYAVAQKRSSAAAEQNKHHYDKKVKSVDLQPHDRVLVRNLSERGGPGKLRAFWEKEVHLVVRRKDPLSPVYEVKRETGEGPSRVLHRNLLLPCNDLPVENHAPPAKPQNKVQQQDHNRQNRVSPRLRKRTAAVEKSISEEDSSSDEEVIVILRNENPSVEILPTHENISAIQPNNESNEQSNERDTFTSEPSSPTVQ